MQVLLVLLLDLYPVKMNTSQNPPSLFFCESGCTLTSCTSHARRGRNGFPNKGEERKKKQNTACKVYMKVLRIRSRNSPLRHKGPRACSRYQPEEKRPSDCYSEEHTTCTGAKKQNQTTGEPQGRKLQKQEFRTNREEKIKASGATYVTYWPHHGNRQPTNVNRHLVAQPAAGFAVPVSQQMITGTWLPSHS